MSWKDRLLKASFRGARFHMEDNSREGGRRVVLHEYPMRDDPATEDMGRRARTFTVNGYTIGENYDLQLEALIAACEAAGPAVLTLPNAPPQMVRCDTYSSLSTREEGGFGSIEMTFIEAGGAPGPTVSGVPSAALSTASRSVSGAMGLV